MAESQITFSSLDLSKHGAIIICKQWEDVPSILFRIFALSLHAQRGVTITSDNLGTALRSR